MAQLEESVGKLSCGGLLTANGRVEAMDEYFKEMLFEIHGAEVNYAVKFASSRLSHRGRVLVGDPSVSILYRREYEAAYGRMPDAGSGAGRVSQAARQTQPAAPRNEQSQAPTASRLDPVDVIRTD